jgi:aspartate/methionine/tyrosine aminotransferase
MQMNPALLHTDAPPVMEARRWLDGVIHPAHRPLINISQAAPVDLPPMALRQAIADAALHNPDAHLYGPVLGLPALRAEVATQFSAAYGGAIAPAQVAITQGCNQAFCAAIGSLAGAGDEVILPTPWYFNHKMWLDMQGIGAIAVPVGAGMIPSADDARAAITARTRAIVLVTPNNPTGAEYPAETLTAFRDVARAHGLALIVDETYRDFDARSGAPHDLFAADWDDCLIQLYSFSKAYRLTGHRVGAIIASESRLLQIEKFLDTIAICPSQLGQIAALWGMQNLRQWLAGERAEILARRAALQNGFAQVEGWQLLGCGAYFAYVRHPFDLASPDLARDLVGKSSLLALPGTMFRPKGDAQGARELRIAFANVDSTALGEVCARLAAYRP